MFIDWYRNLGDEHSTTLIVQQKMTEGKPAFIARLPATYHPSWPSAYGNTGLYLYDRFERGRPSASRACIDRCVVMVLDDVGTKSEAPPLPPTWVMQTSPGNYQWGYVFRRDARPLAGEFEAAIKAIAAVGYTDAAACNAVRNWRLPGSRSLKPGPAGDFPAELVEFHPDREFTLSDICEALGVTPEEADTAAMRRVDLVDDGTDEVWGWLVEQGLVLSRPNTEGWAGIVCPNAEAHSSAAFEARYLPAARAFHCFHEHCIELDSRAFLSWVAEQGGPKAEAGLRAELLVTQMRGALDRLVPNEAFPDRAAEVVAQVERRERGRVERSEWWARYAYVEASDGYFDLVERREVTRAAFNALYRHISCKSVRTGRTVEASISYDEMRQEMGGRSLAGTTYAPGESELCSLDGLVYGNLWTNSRLRGAPGDVSPWLAHVERLLPTEAEREHVLDVLAFKLQNPRAKVNHAILHAGLPGAGKDSLYAPFLYAIGGAERKGNVAIVDAESVGASFQYWLLSEVIVLNELRESEGNARRMLAHRLKPVIAAPPAYLSVNRKMQHPIMVPNRSLVLAFSNESVPIQLDSADRRWFCVKSHGARMLTRDSDALWEWYESGGFDAVAAWLWARDVARFNPSAAPPLTDYKATLVGAGRSFSESYLVDMIEARVGEFAPGVIMGPWQAFCDRLQGAAPGSARLHHHALLHALQEAGWVDLGMVKTPDYSTKRHLFCAPGLADKPKAELRRIAEQAARGSGALAGLPVRRETIK